MTVLTKLSKAGAIAIAAVLLSAGSTHAEVAHVAVASNFAEPIKALAISLEKTTGHQIKVTLGATGKFFAQIKNGAPFDALLAANAETPAALELDGFAQPGSRFTYATGRLVLWSADPVLVDGKGDVLRQGKFRKLAYAAPKVAPYGAAAVQVMENLGLQTLLAPKLVQGESIGQTFSFVFTGNAELGFVAMSQVLEGGQLKSGSMWEIPQPLYNPIAQDAVLLKRGANNPAAQALMALLKTQASKDLIRSYGYAP
ncbi:molybdate ABC transporter substrate-binding protein [Rhodoferax sp. PAMC 29310]|uniref:molybdate ABC transporter substrate-binding protein n=1 Tax=Rhodoferax sp. PAMC 29310 TaxID=2822760 RepID=UPI001B32329B|nr:molybdate ABC transporter substrate-binding protein [Rhodoferax sp. PAMC 29310]